MTDHSPPPDWTGSPGWTTATPAGRYGPGATHVGEQALPSVTGAGRAGSLPPDMAPSGPAAGEVPPGRLRRLVPASIPFASDRLSLTMLWVSLATTLAAADVVAGVPALRAWHVPGAATVLVAAAAGSTAIAFGGVVGLRLSAGLSYLASFVGLVVLLLSADGAHPAAIAGALAHGPNRLITETLPLGGSRISLTPLVVVVWLFGAAAAETVIRSSATDRPRSPLGLGVPIVVYLTCYAVSTGAPGRDRYSGPVLLVALAVSAVLRHRLTTAIADRRAGSEPDDRRPARSRRPIPGDDTTPPPLYRAATAGVVTAVAVAALLTALAPQVPALEAAPVSIHRAPPTATPVITDPVDELGQLRDGRPHAAPVHELTVGFSAPTTGYMGMADLDVYDGDQWQFGATFEPTGGRIPLPAEADPLAGGSGAVSQDVSIVGVLPVPLLPALDRPISVSGLDTVADPVTGMLLPQSETARASYTVVSEAPQATLGGLDAADGIDRLIAAATDTAVPPDTSTDLATTLRFVSNLSGLRPAPTLQFLQQVLDVLHRDEKRIDPTLPVPSTALVPGRHGKATTTTTAPPTAASGTSLSEVINAVTVDRAATPEQFATFYAMVARDLGVPARVVTGFRAAGSSTGSLLGPGTYRLTNRQAWTWVEIPVAGFGWVVADPTPDATTAVAKPPPETGQASATTLPPRQANAVPRNEINGGHAIAPPGHPNIPRPTSTSPYLVAASAAGAILIVLLLAGPVQAALRRSWRRSRRRSTDPSELAVGAWLELLDGLDRAGMRPLPGATHAEVAADVANHFGSELAGEASAVAVIAERAVYSTASPPDEAAARRAWDAQRSLRRRVMATLERGQRMRAALRVGLSARRVRRSGR